MSQRILFDICQVLVVIAFAACAAVHVRSKRDMLMHEVMVGALSGKIEADEVTTAREGAKEKAAERRTTRHSGHRRKAVRG